MKKFFLIVFFFGAIVASQPNLPFAVAKGILNEAGTLRNKDHGLATVLSYHVTKTIAGNPFLLPSSVVQSDNSEVIQLAKEIIKDKNTDHEKSAAIYVWVTENLEYDAETYFATLRGQSFTFKSAMEALESRKAMCMGFSHLTAALHRAAGIEARVVYGKDHAWNEIKLEGRWVPQDTTRGAGYIDLQSETFVHIPNMEYVTKSDIKKEGDYLW
ncbi:transglutaminase domain-containing protein [Bacillus sp. FJAT-18017]|uniref:transglutaminase domain-containing protein n=1 Tax=Bacillus sp. FJAT-18017 TaxID=1705566 RepID=UPI0006AFE0C2|nr:transglutaminase-like domain-containing protein [Bacillus sp. FJAT-18017]